MSSMNIEIEAAVIGFGATLAGAITAVGLEWWRRLREERKEQVHRFNRVLFALLHQRRFLVKLDRHLAPYRDDDRCEYTLPAEPTLPAHLNVDVGLLTFALNSPHANVLNLIADTELKYRTLVVIFDLRSKCHLQFQERLGATIEGRDRPELRDPTRWTKDELRLVAGPILSGQLKSLTDHLFAIADDTLSSNRTVSGELAKAFSKLFPDEMLFRVDEIESAPQEKQASAAKAGGKTTQ
jgi:hypothetical protein